MLLKSCDIRGVLWGTWVRREPQAQRALMTQIVEWCAQGKLSAHVHAVYPLAEIAAALKAIADRKVMEKSCCGRSGFLRAQPRQHGLRRLPVLRLDMRGDRLKREREHRSIVGESDQRQQIGNDIVGHNEIDHRANQHDFDVKRRLAIKGTIMRGQDLFQKWDACRLALNLAPETAPQPRFVGGDPAAERGKIPPGKTWPWGGLLPKTH